MISKKEIKHIANLARIGLDDREIEKFSHDLSAILDWIEELKKADVSLAESPGHTTGLENRMREDEAEKFEAAEKIIKLFPESRNNYDKVKSVL
jgi:aspartyl-tRNA(Asn)/glutamyl-tRNA(Gln) amidotransferase subunit C